MGVNDPGKLCEGTFTAPGLTADGNNQPFSLSMDVPVQFTEGTWYLMIWKGARDIATFNIYPYYELGTKSLELGYNSGLVYIDDGTNISGYQCYIDNGSSWDLAIPYIDNGTSWDMYS